MNEYKKDTEIKNTKMKKNIISLTCAACFLSITTTSHAVELNGNGNIVHVPPNALVSNGHKNPFTKRVPVSMAPSSIPKGLPNNIANLPMGENVPGNFFVRDINESPEAKESKFDWNNMKIVGYVNNNALLRVEDYKNKNNNNSGGNNNNLNGANSNNEIPTVTLMATINEKFFFNKNYYTLKLEKNIFTVFNKNNVAMHTMMISGGAAEIIPKIAGGSGGSEGQGEGQGGNSATGK